MLEERGNSAELDFVSAREVDRLSETLRREIRRRGIDAQTADDLVQESWLRTLRSPPASRGGARLGSWLRVVGQRLVAELRRSNRNRSTRERAAARSERVEAAASDRDDSALARLVAELAEPYREVVRLRFFEGFELDEIAERLSRSPATVRSQLARGLEHLRARLPQSRRRGLPGWFALGLPWRELVSRPGRRWALAAATVVLSLTGLWLLRARGPSPDEGMPRVAALESSRTQTSPTSARESAFAPQPASVPPAAVVASAARLRTIEGRVLTDEGAPQPFAELWSSTRTGPGTPVASADALGRYRVEGLPAELFLWASAAEHCPSRRVYLASIDAAGRHDLVLRATRGVLLLTLLEPDGRPAADVRVELDGQAGRGPSSAISVSGALEIPFAGEVAGTTDASGRVTLVKPDREWLGLRASRGARPLLELTLDAAPADEVREVVLPRPASLAGVVVDAAGRPVAAAEVKVRQLGEVELATVSDAAGRFTVAELAPGPCGASAEARDGLASGQLELVLADGQRAETRIELGPQGTLVGRALDDSVPLAGARVALFIAGKRGEPEQASVTTDTDGRFRFGCTPGAEYWLELTAPGETRPCGWSASVAPGSGRELELCVDPRLRSSEALTLELLGADAEHAPTLAVLRSFQPHLSFEVPVDAHTLRVALDVPPLEYELVVWSPGLGSWNHKQRLRPSPEVQRVLLPRPGVVRLEVELPDGSPDAAFEAGINVAGFNPIGFEELGALGCVREFERDASGRHLRAELYPGRHAWFVRPRGCVPESAYFWVPAGEEVELHAAPAPGVELELVVELPRALRIGEGVSLSAVTPQGEREAFSSGENRRLEHGFATLLTLPTDASALRAFTKFGLAGTHEFAPGELVGGKQRARVELALRLSER